jgi:hypothetical protein
MTQSLNSSRPWRLLWLFPVAVLAVFSVIATGGGGGDDGIDVGDPGDLPLTILPTYNFFLVSLTDEEPFTATLSNALTISVDFDGLFPGAVNLDADTNNNVTFLSYIAKQSARLNLTVTSIVASPLDGTFAVIVTEEINAMVGEQPTSGVFDVVTPTETVAVSILGSSVQLSLNGGAPVVYNTWDEFVDVFDDITQETWQRRAALAAGSFEFIVDLFFNAADVLDDLEAITVSNPLIESCDMFTAAPPDGVLAQGDSTITWLGSGELSPGDDFDWQFNQCWIEDSFELLHGSIRLEDYVERLDGNTLFDIGFGSFSGQPGGVIFDMTIAETEENQGIFTISPDNVVSVTGGFAMIIQQQ